MFKKKFSSLGVSVKMNILLFAPALFIILVLSHGWIGAFKYISLCALVQARLLLSNIHLTDINFKNYFII
jgi:hypothetical protein